MTFLIAFLILQVLQLLSVAHIGTPHVGCAVSINCRHLSNHGDCKHRRHLCVDRLRAPWRVHYPEREDQAVVGLGLLVVTHYVCRDRHLCERVPRTSMGYSE